MRILIIDQDPEAVKHLEKLLSEIAPEMEICGRCRDIKTATKWLQKRSIAGSDHFGNRIARWVEF